MDPSATPDVNYNNATQQQLSTMSIGIIILCILFGLAFVILLLLFMRRRRHHQQQKDPQQQEETSAGFKQRMKERLPWHHHSVTKTDQQERIDDLVFSAIQQHPAPPSHPYHRNHHHQDTTKANGSAMFEEGYSYTQSSTLRGTITRASHCSSSVAPPDTDPILQSLARQREFDRAGYYKNPNAISDRDEEEAMLQRLSMSSYHVW
ncbi:hypothetical protein BJV82DRAFT_601352 [Fennellomyces sp. T-0311]|nr:hypothetical protein BJV82DRAFT_601352 [Fennellomyces sp. T-0311]